MKRDAKWYAENAARIEREEREFQEHLVSNRRWLASRRADPSKRFYGYYISFSATGVESVDDILGAVAMAGKGCHHTGDWSGYGYTEVIQEQAVIAAAEIARLRARVEELEGALRPILAEYDNTLECEIDGERWRVSAYIHTHLMEQARAALDGKEASK